MWWLLVLLAVVVVVYWRLRRRLTYWTERGVKQGKPKVFVGDSSGLFTGRQSLAELVEMVYNMIPNTRYSGFYNLSLPILVLKDPELIKQITVKDFDHFTDRRPIIPEDADPLWSNNLFALTGRNWREMRSTLSPAFTSSKMKFMFSLIAQNGQQFINHFLEKNEDIVTIEMKDTFTRFTNDAIANTAFGIECDSLKDPSNDFFTMGKEITDFTGFWKTFKIFGFFFIPRIFKMLNVTLFAKNIADFFNTVIRSNITSREKQGIVRPDMIHLLLEARRNGFKHEESQPSQDTGFATVEESEMGTNPKDQKREITDQDITSQALLFFFAGFDSVSGLMCFMSYELAVNPDIQDKLIREVDETLEACKGKLSYDGLLGMKYMDMVVSEALRKWPISAALDRICTKPYTIQPKYPDEKPVHLEKDTVVWLPFYGLHRDPRYYPEPERFDPERFSDENKDKIEPYTYLPFGSGPRNCIGSRFALLETKILFFFILQHFQIVPVEKTQVPLKISKKHFNLHAEGGFWLGLKRRLRK